MKTRLLTLLLAAGLLAAAALTVLTFSASAQSQTVYVQLPTGEVVPVTVDVPPGATLDDIQLPGPQVAPPTTPTTPPGTNTDLPNTSPDAPTPANPGGDQGPSSDGGSQQEHSSSGRRVQDRQGPNGELTGDLKSRAKDELSKAKRKGRR
ncbi:MAG TPA: hypothetical protein VGO83_06740, partial [Thermoleophilaceae bacterium]|nr:hypothetical protein [Thermoleophilaceae bacterium]